MRKTADVLVAGGGAAAVRAACAAADTGANVLMVTGGDVGAGGSTYYPFSPAWGIMYADSDADCDVFYQEILSSGMGCMKPALVRRLVEDSRARYRELQNWGLSFRSLEDIRLTTCFGAVLRGAVLDDVANLRAPFLRQLQRRGVRVLAQLEAIDLCVQDGRCCGLLCAGPNGETVRLAAGAVVLATGGAESLWEYRCAGEGLLGAAYAMAARHGAPVVNLEFIQFLLGTLSPVPHTLFYHFTLSTHPELLDADGQPLLSDLPEGVTPDMCLDAHARHGPFTTVDASQYLERAILARTRTQRPLRGVQLRYTQDISRLPSFAHWNGYLQRMRVRPMAQPFWLYPHCQGFNGGIEIDENAATAIAGLYACGESAGGIHGANRMGGNAILATQVFGRIAGISAAAFARAHPPCALTPAAFTAPRGADCLSAWETLDRLRALMQRHAFLERDEQGLSLALAGVRELQAQFDPQARAAAGRTRLPYAVANALTAAQLILSSMRRRTHTCGSHFRTDAPAQSMPGLLQPLRLDDEAETAVERPAAR